MLGMLLLSLVHPEGPQQFCSRRGVRWDNTFSIHTAHRVFMGGSSQMLKMTGACNPIITDSPWRSPKHILQYSWHLLYLSKEVYKNSKQVRICKTPSSDQGHIHAPISGHFPSMGNTSKIQMRYSIRYRVEAMSFEELANVPTILRCQFYR
jgi:hypothetical protein